MILKILTHGTELRPRPVSSSFWPVQQQPGRCPSRKARSTMCMMPCITKEPESDSRLATLMRFGEEPTLVQRQVGTGSVIAYGTGPFSVLFRVVGHVADVGLEVFLKTVLAVVAADAGFAYALMEALESLEGLAVHIGLAELQLVECFHHGVGI